MVRARKDRVGKSWGQEEGSERWRGKGLREGEQNEGDKRLRCM